MWAQPLPSASRAPSRTFITRVALPGCSEPTLVSPTSKVSRNVNACAPLFIDPAGDDVAAADLVPAPGTQGQNPQLLFKVTDRVILSYSNAKRLAMSLTQLIKRYEQQFGELPVQPGQRR